MLAQVATALAAVLPKKENTLASQRMKWAEEFASLASLQDEGNRLASEERTLVESNCEHLPEKLRQNRARQVQLGTLTFAAMNARRELLRTAEVTTEERSLLLDRKLLGIGREILSDELMDGGQSSIRYREKLLQDDVARIEKRISEHRRANDQAELADAESALTKFTREEIEPRKAKMNELASRIGEINKRLDKLDAAKMKV